MEYHVELHALSGRREPPRKLHLTLLVRPGSDEEYVVCMELGAIGSDRHTQEWAHRTMSEAKAQVQEILSAQMQTGFRVVTSSPGHPLREWLASEVVVDEAPEQRVEEEPIRARRRPAPEPAKKAIRAEQLSLF